MNAGRAITAALKQQKMHDTYKIYCRLLAKVPHHRLSMMLLRLSPQTTFDYAIAQMLHELRTT